MTLKKNSKYILISAISLPLFYLAFFYEKKEEIKPQVAQSSVVSMQNDTQIINVFAKGGYFPPKVTAQSGKKTILRIQTENSFDCSSAFVMPSLGLKRMLPQTGVTEIEISPQSSGTELLGSCSMGMYQLKINFN